MAARFAALVTGAAVWKTTSAVSPDLVGNRESSMFAACCEGVLPAVKSFWKWVPTSWATAVIPTSSRIHASTTVRRWS